MWWTARLSGLWLITLGVLAWVSAIRNGVAISWSGLAGLGLCTGLPGVGLLLMPKLALRPTIALLSLLLGITLPILLIAHDRPNLLGWIAFLVPWLALVVTRYRFLRKPIDRSAQ